VAHLLAHRQKSSLLGTTTHRLHTALPRSLRQSLTCIVSLWRSTRSLSLAFTGSTFFSMVFCTATKTLGWQPLHCVHLSVRFTLFRIFAWVLYAFVNYGRIWMAQWSLLLLMSSFSRSHKLVLDILLELKVVFCKQVNLVNGLTPTANRINHGQVFLLLCFLLQNRNFEVLLKDSNLIQQFIFQ